MPETDSDEQESRRDNRQPPEACSGVLAEAGLAAGVSAPPVPASNPSAPPAPRNGRKRADRTARDRMARWRRRGEWHRWRMWHVGQCVAMAGGVCPYFAAPEKCGAYRVRTKRPVGALPACLYEKLALLDVSDALAAAGYSGPIAMAISSGLLASSRAGDGRLLSDVLRQFTCIGIELARAQARDGRNGGAAGLDGYLGALLAGGSDRPAACAAPRPSPAAPGDVAGSPRASGRAGAAALGDGESDMPGGAE